MLFQPLLLAALLTSSALAFKAVNPNSDALRPLSMSLSARAPGDATNAKRLADGLPPLRPRGRSKLPGTQVDVARRHHPSGHPAPQRLCGRIDVKDAADGSRIGYMSTTFNIFGEYGITTSPAQALRVCFDSPSPGQVFDLVAENQDQPFKFVGGIVGYASSNDDLLPGSFNYLYLGGVLKQTPPRSPPLTRSNSFTVLTGIPKNVETAIWRLVPHTSELVPQWINTDRSSTPNQVIFYPSDNFLGLVGDLDAFRVMFGGPALLVHLVFAGF